MVQDAHSDEAENRRSRSTRQQGPFQDGTRKLYGISTCATENSDGGSPHKVSNGRSSSRRQSADSQPLTKWRRLTKEETDQQFDAISEGDQEFCEAEKSVVKKEAEEPGSPSPRRRKGRTISDMDSVSPRTNSLLPPKDGSQNPQKPMEGIPKPSEALFRNRPSWIPRRPPVNVLDDWFHGQLVWWNRFLANRKKTRGYSTGYHVGRVVDLDSEWFPNVELSDTKKRLRLQASQLGRRSVFVQSMDDLRYMAIPPRAVTPYPDLDPSRNAIILEGCRVNSAASHRGLLRAQMIEQLREAVGEMNSLLEIELLNLVFHGQGEDPSCCDGEVQFLQNTNVWEVLSTRKVTSRGASDETRLMVPPVLVSMPSERRVMKQPRPVDMRIRGRPGRPRKKKEVESDNDDDLGFEQPYRQKRRRQPLSPGEIVAPTPLPKRHRTGSTDATELQKWEELCNELCITRRQLEDMLTGIPFTLLASSTGLPLPEELPEYTLQILQTFLRSSPLFVSSQPSVATLVRHHYAAANLFLHKLFKTIALHIPIKPETIPSPPNEPSVPAAIPLSNIPVDDQSSVKIEPLPTAPDSPFPSAPVENPSIRNHDIVFLMDHGHVNVPSSPLQPPTEETSPYLCCEHFPCISYHHPPWSCLLHPERGFMPDEGPKLEKSPRIKCRKSTLLLVGHGTNMKLPYYNVRLNQVSAKKPSKQELEAAGQVLLGSGLEKFSLHELDRRVHRLYDLKQVALELRSIYDDETALLCQSNGTLLPRDIRYFESLWQDLLTKLKS